MREEQRHAHCTGHHVSQPSTVVDGDDDVIVMSLLLFLAVSLLEWASRKRIGSTNGWRMLKA